MKSVLHKIFNMTCQMSVVTFLCSSVYIASLKGADCWVLLSYIWGVIGVCFILSVGWLPFMGEKELSKSQMFFGKLLYFILTNVLVFGVGYYLCWFTFDYKITILYLELTVLVVWGLMNVSMYLRDKRQAKHMLEKLKSRISEDNE